MTSRNYAILLLNGRGYRNHLVLGISANVSERGLGECTSRKGIFSIQDYVKIGKLRPRRGYDMAKAAHLLRPENLGSFCIFNSWFRSSVE